MTVDESLLDPGPVDPSVLYRKDKHISNLIWAGKHDRTLHTRNHEKCPVVEDIVQHYLHRAGFYGLYQLQFCRVDRALITAVVERFRPETNTVHLPVGECTITLQDIEVLAGVSVDGKAVISDSGVKSESDWLDIVEDLLGVRPDLSDVTGKGLRMTWIRKHFKGVLPKDADEKTIIRHTRAYIMLLLGGQFLADKSGGRVKLCYLPLLKDLDECRQYSWGAAILAVIYREMGRAALVKREKTESSDIAGSCMLIQLWAMTRFSFARPTTELPVNPTPIEGLPPKPYGWRFVSVDVRLETDVAAHQLRFYRDQFEMMQAEQMNWEPYKDVLEHLPEYCLAGRHIWLARVPLICEAVVEYHYPDRVIRQFGMRQARPQDCIRNDGLAKTDGRGNTGTNWMQKHKEYVKLWDKRLESVVMTQEHQGVMHVHEGYMEWYLKITRKYIIPPSTVPSRGFQDIGGIIALQKMFLTRCYKEMKATGNHGSLLAEMEKAFMFLKHVHDPPPPNHPPPPNNPSPAHTTSALSNPPAQPHYSQPPTQHTRRPFYWENYGPPPQTTSLPPSSHMSHHSVPPNNSPWPHYSDNYRSPPPYPPNYRPPPSYPPNYRPPSSYPPNYRPPPPHPPPPQANQDDYRPYFQEDYVARPRHDYRTGQRVYSGDSGNEFFEQLVMPTGGFETPYTQTQNKASSKHRRKRQPTREDSSSSSQSFDSGGSESHHDTVPRRFRNITSLLRQA